jgi:predicted regulator of Ras-like GTPase activity (Roadblock/LC7/MglB family)
LPRSKNSCSGLWEYDRFVIAVSHWIPARPLLSVQLSTTRAYRVTLFRHTRNEMAETPFIIQERQFQRLKSILARLCVECAARVVFLVDRDGQPIAFHGDIGDMDTTSFSSLAAGNVAATTSMAKLIGEDVFPAVVHEGERESIYISVIGRSLLVVVFDERSTVGLVKIRSKRASHEVSSTLDEMAEESAISFKSNNSFFAEITDEDIDSLFAQ